MLSVLSRCNKHTANAKFTGCSSFPRMRMKESTLHDDFAMPESTSVNRLDILPMVQFSAVYGIAPRVKHIWRITACTDVHADLVSVRRKFLSVTPFGLRVLFNPRQRQKHIGRPQAPMIKWIIVVVGWINFLSLTDHKLHTADQSTLW